MIVKVDSNVQVGMAGEKMQLYTEEGSQKVKWGPTSSNGADGPLSWYKVSTH